MRNTISSMKRGIAGAALVVLLLAGYWWWSRPARLTPEDQLRGEVEILRRAVENRQTGNIMNRLHRRFTWSGSNRQEFQSYLIGAFFEWRNIDLQLSPLKIQVQGDSATTGGTYILQYRPRPDEPLTTRTGRFLLHWQQADGKWQVVKAEGAENNDHSLQQEEF